MQLVIENFPTSHLVPNKGKHHELILRLQVSKPYHFDNKQSMTFFSFENKRSGTRDPEPQPYLDARFRVVAKI